MKLYNQKTKSIEDLKLDKVKPVKMYTCGPTVYDYPHIGNWYTFIRYDALNRTLNLLDYKTNWVLNITDVGHIVNDADEGMDKLEKGAQREGKTAWEVAEFYSDYFIKYLKELNFSKINHLPKATDYIEEQLDLVLMLEKKNYTYQTSTGIYFDTSKFSKYADFANLNLAGQNEGARVDVNEEKKHASDFAIWKFSPKDQKRDMEWDSPWGKSFPGWHLECSAMIHAILGEPIDIHGGGIDHIQIHHTNEIAQSEAAFDRQLASYWFHCNHIMVDGKKMSKSLGNLYTLEDIINKKYNLDVFRLSVLSGHYRSQSEFDWSIMEAQKQRMQNWLDKISEIKQTKTQADNIVKNFKEELSTTLSNDLNTPLAISLIDAYVEKISNEEIDDFIELINQALGINLSKYLKPIDNEIENLLKKREQLRVAKDWQQSDSIRQLLHEKGIKVQDSNMGQIWSRLI